MPYTCTCRIATGGFTVHVYVLVVRGNVPVLNVATYLASCVRYCS